MKTLELCPFCGSDHVGIADRWTMDHKQQFSVWCYECQNHSTWRYAKETAVAEWKMACERAKVMKPMGDTDESDRSKKGNGRSVVMKTLDEVIAELEDEGLFADALHYLKEYQVLQSAYIKAMADLEDNPPLTWDELRLMEGKPVWVEPVDEKGYWFVIEFFNNNPYYGGDRVCFTNDVMLNRSDLGNTWQAYRKERK